MLHLEDDRKDRPYLKAYEARSSSSREGNPIAKAHPRVPYKADIEALVATFAAERNLNNPTPAIPSSTWTNNHVVMGTPHYLTMRSSSYRFREMKEWRRDAGMLCTAFLWEYYYMLEYRPAILKGASGLIRHRLLQVLRPDLPANMIVSIDGAEFLRFWDEYYFAPAVDDGPELDQAARLRGAQIQKELFGEFNQFFKRFKNLKSNKLLSSRFFADEGSPMEGRVAATWNSFAEVRVALICVHSYSNFVSGL